MKMACLGFKAGGVCAGQPLMLHYSGPMCGRSYSLLPPVQCADGVTYCYLRSNVPPSRYSLWAAVNAEGGYYYGAVALSPASY